jgi:hypothetical protein
MNKLPEPPSEIKLAMLEFMKKHALPKRLEAKKNEKAS